MCKDKQLLNSLHLKVEEWSWMEIMTFNLYKEISLTFLLKFKCFPAVFNSDKTPRNVPKS